MFYWTSLLNLGTATTPLVLQFWEKIALFLQNICQILSHAQSYRVTILSDLDFVWHNHHIGHQILIIFLFLKSSLAHPEPELERFEVWSWFLGIWVIRCVAQGRLMMIAIIVIGPPPLLRPVCHHHHCHHHRPIITVTITVTITTIIIITYTATITITNTIIKNKVLVWLYCHSWTWIDSTIISNGPLPLLRLIHHHHQD